jgi:hypothetical protein
MADGQAWEMKLKEKNGWVDNFKASAKDIQANLVKHGKAWAAATDYWQAPAVVGRWRSAYEFGSGGKVRPPPPPASALAPALHPPTERCERA